MNEPSLTLSFFTAQLKSICVPILTLARTSKSVQTTASLSQLLRLLHTTLIAVPQTVFSPPLADYIFFPLSALLRPGEDGQARGDDVVEGTMNALEVLVRKWRGVEVGMDSRLLHELWILAILKLGGPLDPAKPTNVISEAKGKGKERSESSEAAMLNLLLTILRPVSMIKEEQARESLANEEMEDEDDYMGANIDWDADEVIPTQSKSKSKPVPSPIPFIAPSPPPIPIMFHTLTTLLTFASRSTALLSLQTAALEGLHLLIEFYLAPSTSPGPSPLLATALPGAASSLSRILLSSPSSKDPALARKQPTPVLVASLNVLCLLITSTLNDNVTISLRSDVISSHTSGTLEELGERFTEGEIVVDDISIPLAAPPLLTSASTPSGPTLPTTSWLNHTIERVTALLTSLTILASHDSPLVRSALSAFISTILESCSATLITSKRTLLETLLLLANDSWPDVSSSSQAGVEKLMAENDEYVMLSSAIVRDRMIGLPRAILRGDEASVRASSKIVRAGLQYSILSGSSSSNLGLLEGTERWSWSLLRSLSFEKINTTTTRTGANQAWITSGDTFETGISETTAWPTLRMMNLHDTSTLKDLGKVWNAMGSSAKRAGKERDIVAPFLRIVVDGDAGDGTALCAALVLDGILKGFEVKDEFEVGKSTRKVVKSVVKGILGLLERLAEEDETEEDKVARGPVVEEQSSMDVTMEETTPILVEVEHRRGAVSLTPTLDGLSPIVTTTATASALARASHRILLLSLSLRILSTAASLLASSFQPYLLGSLYHILSHLSATSHPILREHAQLALAQIAYSTSYASSQNLILANVDYVINSVSQRLSISRLDPQAPLVLVEMIRLVGEPIVPMVQDLVEDVFEALDDYHGYEEITVGLWAVLDALMSVMAGTVIENGEKRKERIETGKNGETKKEGDGTWNAFVAWYEQKRIVLDEDPADEEINPRTPFSSTLPEEEEKDEPVQPEEIKIPPTRSQLVSSQILSKAVYFLSHSSPLLRARVISLLTSAIPLLCSPSSAEDSSSTRESDLLPVIHRSWPYILNRFNDNEPYVILEVVKLIEALAEFVGTFMSRRILDDVWPRFKLLLLHQQPTSTSSSVDRKEMKGRVVEISPGEEGSTTGRFTQRFRIYQSILKTMITITESVPLREEIVWDLVLSFRGFLDNKIDEELQRLTRVLYVAMGKINQDIVWLVLSSMQGQNEGMKWLVKRGMNVDRNVEIILNSLQ